MDLLDYQTDDLYFDREVLPPYVEKLLDSAAGSYVTNSPHNSQSERFLLQAQLLCPQNLTVLVALYRFYYYQHRYQDALTIVRLAIDVSASELGIRLHWRDLHVEYLGVAVMQSMSLLRFYLLALKATAYLHLRLGELHKGRELLSKVSELDPHDRLGAKVLLKVVNERYEINAEEMDAVV